MYAEPGQRGRDEIVHAPVALFPKRAKVDGFGRINDAADPGNTVGCSALRILVGHFVQSAEGVGDGNELDPEGRVGERTFDWLQGVNAAIDLSFEDTQAVAVPAGSSRPR